MQFVKCIECIEWIQKVVPVDSVYFLAPIVQLKNKAVFVRYQTYYGSDILIPRGKIIGARGEEDKGGNGILTQSGIAVPVVVNPSLKLGVELATRYGTLE